MEPTAIAVSRLSPVKDIADACSRPRPAVGRELPEFRLRIVGDGPAAGKLEELARGLGLERHASSSWGSGTTFPPCSREAGFFVSSSLSEGLSLTLAEAMAVGLPVLATAVGGNPEVIVEGVTGRLVPAGDPRALADGLLGAVDGARSLGGWAGRGASACSPTSTFAAW